MGEVIELLRHQPHIESVFVCLSCKHEWHGIAPIGLVEFECPKCSLLKGVFKGTCVPAEPIWECACGCLHFYVAEEAAYCCNCGIAQKF